MTGRQSETVQREAAYWYGLHEFAVGNCPNSLAVEKAHPLVKESSFEESLRDR